MERQDSALYPPRQTAGRPADRIGGGNGQQPAAEVARLIYLKDRVKMWGIVRPLKARGGPFFLRAALAAGLKSFSERSERKVNDLRPAALATGPCAVLNPEIVCDFRHPLSSRAAEAPNPAQRDASRLLYST